MFCDMPFRELHVLDRQYATCCGIWLDAEARVVAPGTDAPWGVWNHPRLVRLRETVLDGSFRFCRFCPRYVARRLRNERRAEHKPTMERGPAILHLAQDRSCNLHCWSCREAPIMRTPTDRQGRVLSDFTETFLPRAKVLSLAGSGDALASKLYYGFLRSLSAATYPGLTIRLFTNGLLLPKAWPKLRAIHPCIRRLAISIDAATAETYERVRRGGQWHDLLAALTLAAALRRSGQLDELNLNFCIRAANFREMPAFVRLGLQYEATLVHFGMLRRWWQSPEEYARENLADPAHPDYGEFRRVLEDPMLNHPIVGPGVFRPELHQMILLQGTKR